MSDENKDFDGIRYRKEDRSPAVFRILFTVLIVWAVGFMGYYLFSGWSSEADLARKKAAQEQQAANRTETVETQAAGSKESGKEEQIAAAKKEFADRCAACHGPEGKGGIGPDLSRKEFKFGKTEQDIILTISDGRPGGMPVFKNDLSHEKIEGLARFILTLK